MSLLTRLSVLFFLVMISCKTPNPTPSPTPTPTPTPTPSPTPTPTPTPEPAPAPCQDLGAASVPEKGVIVESATPIPGAEHLYGNYYFIPPGADFQAGADQKVYPDDDVFLIEPIEEVTQQRVGKKAAYKNWGLENINAAAFRKKAEGRKLGRNAKVAVIDTGGCFQHPDLKSVYKGGYNGIDSSKPAADDNGHGCHVSGTIGGATTYSVAGGYVDLFAGKFLSKDGGGSISAAIRATKKALDWGADVVSNSWGGGGEYKPYTDLVKAAMAKGVIFTFAAGNDNAKEASYPSSIPGGVSVASHTSLNKRSSFSNWGPQVWVSFPGSAIYSTWYDNKFKSISGTSMATPHAAGVAALLLQAGLKPTEVVSAMTTKYAAPVSWVKYGRVVGDLCK